MTDQLHVVSVSGGKDSTAVYAEQVLVQRKGFLAICPINTDSYMLSEQIEEKQ